MIYQFRFLAWGVAWLVEFLFYCFCYLLRFATWFWFPFDYGRYRQLIRISFVARNWTNLVLLVIRMEVVPSVWVRWNFSVNNRFCSWLTGSGVRIGQDSFFHKNILNVLGYLSDCIFLPNIYHFVVDFYWNQGYYHNYFNFNCRLNFNLFLCLPNMSCAF